MWTVTYSEYFAEWYISLSDKLQRTVVRAIDLLEGSGPAHPSVRRVLDSLTVEWLAISATDDLQLLFLENPLDPALLLVGGHHGSPAADGSHWAAALNQAVSMTYMMSVADVQALQLEEDFSEVDIEGMRGISGTPISELLASR